MHVFAHHNPPKAALRYNKWKALKKILVAKEVKLRILFCLWDAAVVLRVRMRGTVAYGKLIGGGEGRSLLKFA